jgi:hypothetical protein
LSPWVSTAGKYVALALLIVFLGVAWWWVPKWQVNRLRATIPDAKARADVEDNWRKTIGQLYGGAAVLLATGFAYYQFKETLKQTELSRQASQKQADRSVKASRDLLISQQVSKGFEQLGSDKLVLRLGGIYALEGAMNASPEYHRPIVESLCAFIRDTTRAPGPEEKEVTTDIQAALTVLGRRATVQQETLDLSNTVLRNADLTGANLAGANLSAARLSGINLSAANLSGANLAGAKLSGAKLFRTNLAGANLSGATFLAADLSGAVLLGANLSEAFLSAANLSEANDLTQAQLDQACGDQTKLRPGFTIRSCIK